MIYLTEWGCRILSSFQSRKYQSTVKNNFLEVEELDDMSAEPEKCIEFCQVRIPGDNVLENFCHHSSSNGIYRFPSNKTIFLGKIWTYQSKYSPAICASRVR